MIEDSGIDFSIFICISFTEYPCTLVVSYKEDEMGWACSTHGAMRNMYKMLVQNTEEKRLLRRPSSRWKNNVRLDLKKQCGKMWTGCAWLRIGNSGGPCEHSNELLGSIKGG